MEPKQVLLVGMLISMFKHPLCVSCWAIDNHEENSVGPFIVCHDELSQEDLSLMRQNFSRLYNEVMSSMKEYPGKERFCYGMHVNQLIKKNPLNDEDWAYLEELKAIQAPLRESQETRNKVQRTRRDVPKKQPSLERIKLKPIDLIDKFLRFNRPTYSPIEEENSAEQDIDETMEDESDESENTPFSTDTEDEEINNLLFKHLSNMNPGTFARVVNALENFAEKKEESDRIASTE